MKNLSELFLDELADVYSAEKQLVKALPAMAEAASSTELKDALETHLTQTEEHVRRIEEVFETCDAKPKAKKCEAMKGLLEEAQHAIDEEGDPAVRDAAIIAAAQKVEHYEIATYGTLRTWAELMENDDAVALLEETGTEEKEADEMLTDIAESINMEANAEIKIEEKINGRRITEPKSDRRR